MVAVVVVGIIFAARVGVFSALVVGVSVAVAAGVAVAAVVVVVVVVEPQELCKQRFNGGLKE